MASERSAIVCPNCGRRYAVPEGSIGLEGRTVVCIGCSHSWTAHPEDLAAVPVQVRIPEATPETPPVIDLAPPHEDAASVDADDLDRMPAQDDVFDETRRRRSRRVTKIFTLAGAACAVVSMAGAGFILMTAQPFGSAVDAPMSVRIASRPVRQQVADGRQTISTTAEIFNPGSAPRAIPAMKATMKTPDGRIVKQWRVAPPGGTLAANARTTVQIGTVADPDTPAGPLRLDVDLVGAGG